jgi:hypothetical protein
MMIGLIFGINIHSIACICCKYRSSGVSCPVRPGIVLDKYHVSYLTERVPCIPTSTFIVNRRSYVDSHIFKKFRCQTM